MIGFNTFVHIAAHSGVGITYDRNGFFDYYIQREGNQPLSVHDWWQLWEQFCQDQDVADERETQLAALGVAS